MSEQVGMQRNRDNSVFVGSLAFSATEDDVRQVFEQAGNVVNVKICTDRETGRARGFGFVEFEDAAGAEKAVAECNGAEICGRAVRVDKSGNGPAAGGKGKGKGGFGGGFQRRF